MTEPVDDAAELTRIQAVIDAGPYTDTWESLSTYEPPRWFVDGKFGIFIHWGVYSVPAFGNEWYARTMYVEGSEAYQHHLKTYGAHDVFGYKDFIPSFTADAFDASQWAELFRRAGAQFVVPVAEHHDGFAMYETDRSRWKATAMGPRRDVVGELGAAVRRQAMTFGASTHRAEHWWFMNGGVSIPSDVLDADTADFYGPAMPQTMQPNDAYLIDWFLRTVELIDRYDLSVLQYKYEAFAPGSAVFDVERGALDGIHPHVWQNDTSVSRNSWSWIGDAHQYKATEEIIAELVDVVAKNGALLLNIGPKPDGTIAEPEQDILLGIGRWLQVHGEAVYGTRPWLVAAEGPSEQRSGYFTDATATSWTAADIRFTSRSGIEGDFVYATALDWPADGRLVITSLATTTSLAVAEIDQVSVLGSKAEVTWSRGPEGLVVQLPRERPSDFGVTVRAHLVEPSPRTREIGFVH